MVTIQLYQQGLNISHSLKKVAKNFWQDHDFEFLEHFFFSNVYAGFLTEISRIYSLNVINNNLFAIMRNKT